MRKADVYLKGTKVGVLIEDEEANHFTFEYLDEYDGSPISVTLPVRQTRFEFDSFPPFFDGLLPEGVNLEHLLRVYKLDRDDRFGQLLAVGEDTVGAVTVREATP
jgi:serine/threonine-protein kinase HipA